MQVEVRGVVVAEVEGAGAVAGKLVGAGTANADERIGPRDDDDFAIDASSIVSAEYEEEDEGGGDGVRTCRLSRRLCCGHQACPRTMVVRAEAQRALC